MTLKLSNLREQLKKEEIDALLITNPYNRSYMTNFTGTAGVAIVSVMMLYSLQISVILNKPKKKLKAIELSNILKQLLKKLQHKSKHERDNTWF